MKKMLTIAMVAVFLTASAGMLLAHDLKDAFQFISPMPGAMYVNKGTHIVIRPGENLANYNFNRLNPAGIVGSVSGNHEYEAVVAVDQKTVVLKPYRLFEPGEVVTITIESGLKAKTTEKGGATIYSFNISPKRQKLADEEDWSFPEYIPNNNPFRNDGLLLDRDISLPSDWPTITTNSPGIPGDGYLFSTYKLPDNSGYLIIIDNDGNPIFYRKTEVNATRFNVAFGGILTFGQSLKRSPLWDDKFYAMDQTYTVIDTFEMVGYELDTHDFQLTEDWESWMFNYDYQYIDMRDSVPGGDSLCRIEGFIIQRLDSLKNLVFSWSSWDNLNVMDCQHFDMTSNRINATHINALGLDDDGNILISVRGFCACYKIDRLTGDIIWKLSKHGPNSSFTFVNDTAGFCWQHNIRRIDNGHVTIFDNGCFNTPQESRVVEYDLDTTAWTATLTWEYRPSPSVYAPTGGSGQRLPNGNTLTSFSSSGIDPAVLEVHMDSTIAFEVSGLGGCNRYQWTGIAALPYLVAETTEDGVHLVFNKFGDYPDSYKIYMGESPNPTTAIDSTINNYYDVTGLLGGKTYYFRVTAIDYVGFESDYSNEEEVTWWLPYTPGDANGDGNVIGSDVTFSTNYFRSIGGNPPDSVWNSSTSSWLYVAADANGDCSYIGSDVTFMINYLRGGAYPEYCPETPPFGEE